jgi:membrane protein
MKWSLASISERIGQLAERLSQAVTRPQDELDRWQRAARFLYELGITGLRQLRYDRAPQMAGELAFRTLFGLLPVMVVAAVLVKALGMEQWILEPLSNLLNAAGLAEVQVALTPDGAKSESLNVWLEANFVEATRLNLSTIGWVGFLVTAYAAIGLIVTIENSFNTIFRVQRGRPWTRRVPLYWFMLTVSPLVLVLGTYLSTQLQNMMAGVEVWSWVSSGASLAWSLFILWFVMALFYSLMPNTNVNLRPAMAGALVAAILLEIGKRTLATPCRSASCTDRWAWCRFSCSGSISCGWLCCSDWRSVPSCKRCRADALLRTVR